MFKLIAQLFQPRISGTAHRGANPVFITDVYADGYTWMFSWTKSDGSDGAITPFYSQADAAAAREQFIKKMTHEQHAQFIHRGMARAAGR